jgi:hypothetical protein
MAGWTGILPVHPAAANHDSKNRLTGGLWGPEAVTGPRLEAEERRRKPRFLCDLFRGRITALRNKKILRLLPDVFS